MAERRFIPETPEALNAEWLTEVLTPEKPYAHVERTVLGEEGFVGDILRLACSDEDGQARSVVAKLPKLENRVTGELLGAYEREIMFYQTLGNDVPIRTPKLFYADFDRDRGSENQEAILRKADGLPRWTNIITTTLGKWIAGAKKRRYVLLIEDLGYAEPGNQIAGATREKCRHILEEVARMHAAYWESDQLGEHFWLLPMDVDTNMRHTMSTHARPTFDRLFADAAPRLAPYLNEVPEHGVQWVRTLAEGPTTLLHYDLRLDNLMFDGDEVIFIDWQLTRRGHPAYDVAYFLSSALEDQASAADLLAHYHAALTREGAASNYTLGKLMQDYAIALHVVAMSLTGVDEATVAQTHGAPLLGGWMQRLANRLEADGHNIGTNI